MKTKWRRKREKITEPAILSGFLELLPREQMMMTHMTDIIKKTFESYGFIPLDTPVLEKAEVLLAKAEAIRPNRYIVLIKATVTLQCVLI